MMEKKSGMTESVRVLQTVPSNTVPTARNRGGKLGDEMRNPTLGKIYRATVVQK
jgi:hypothetical protein